MVEAVGEGVTSCKSGFSDSCYQACCLNIDNVQPCKFWRAKQTVPSGEVKKRNHVVQEEEEERGICFCVLCFLRGRVFFFPFGVSALFERRRGDDDDTIRCDVSFVMVILCTLLFTLMFV